MLKRGWARGLGDDPQRSSYRAACEPGGTGWDEGGDRRARPPGCSCTRVGPVASAQAPRRRRPDRPITVTAPPGLAVCNRLSHWLPGEGADWPFLVLIPELNPARAVISEIALPPSALGLNRPRPLLFEPPPHPPVSFYPHVLLLVVVKQNVRS